MTGRSSSTAGVARAIVRWFEKNARDLPWRRTKDPYAIWISEVMLQQTQVRTVIAYWERWMNLFPTMAELASAPEERVLKAWEGLGYYRRARNLQKAAVVITSKFAGAFPNAYDEILQLPGVGRYTAGAISSIAFDRPLPIVDGNVRRVLSRLYMIVGEPDLWRSAENLVKTAPSPSALNQGLMEIGATICTPREPNCPHCPLREHCVAFARGRVSEYPPKPAKTTFRVRRFVALTLLKGDSVLVRKRRAEAVNGGLWEFPNFELAPRRGLKPQVREFLGQHGKDLQALATIRHVITNNRITLNAYRATAVFCGSPPFESEWRRVVELEQLPFSSAHAQIRRALQGAIRTENRGEVT